MEIEIAGKKINTVYAMGDNHVKVELQMRTNIPGCFACGDIAGKPYQYIKAAGQENDACFLFYKSLLCVMINRIDFSF